MRAVPLMRAVAMMMSEGPLGVRNACANAPPKLLNRTSKRARELVDAFDIGPQPTQLAVYMLITAVNDLRIFYDALALGA